MTGAGGHERAAAVAPLADEPIPAARVRRPGAPVDPQVRAQALARYRDRRHSGETVRAIAADLGVSVKSISQWAHQHLLSTGVPGGAPVLAEVRAAAVRRYSAGDDPLWLIARQLHVSVASIRFWARQAGLTGRPRARWPVRPEPVYRAGHPRDVPEDQWRMVLALFEQGRSARALITQFDLPISECTFTKWARLNGKGRDHPDPAGAPETRKEGGGR